MTTAAATSARGLVALLSERALSQDSRPALVEISQNGMRRRKTSRDLDQVSAAVSSRLARRARADGPVVACFPGSPILEAIEYALGALRAGIPLFPMPADLETPDRVRLLHTASAIGIPVDPATGSVIADCPAGHSRPAPPGLVEANVLLATSGTTGPPNLVAHRFDLIRAGTTGFSLLFGRAGWRAGQRQLLTLPCSHIAPIQAAIRGVVDGNTIVTMNVVTGELLDLALEHQIDWMLTAPHQMAQAAASSRAMGERVPRRLSVLHTGSGCPAATKRAWISTVGPENLFEMYGGTEAPGMTFVDGVTWLERPGTVGKGFLSRVSIRDESGVEVPPGVEGEVYLKTFRTGTPVGGEHWLRRTDDGFMSLGDVGSLDDDGYLFVKGRRAQRVRHHGVAVWLTELESAIAEHPAVSDVAVEAFVECSSTRISVTVAVADRATAPSSPEIEQIVRRFGHAAMRIEEPRFVSQIDRTAIGKRRLARPGTTLSGGS
ncbi:MAG TPA: AMP-binding protein [Chloroflexota bacterium]